VITSDSGRRGEKESNRRAHHSGRSRGDENAASGGECHNARDKADDNRTNGARISLIGGERRGEADKEW
jgi:hypothetical protein